ncbi:uncharacterized protein LOC131342946 [Hemibagrus wyckioides]|uniref:uncharacterized protein LOC131342946 n=1 Tax=Hemibagrus wyckioides TaxID=337641 RepID=UPI00266C376D|nr:uncharacterized protein LOC131342946 [Hemibagrus wyckioides]XP_058230273.1 uncharacterized protein LOC131342946 [Hemibagrus wyckioides]
MWSSRKCMKRGTCIYTCVKNRKVFPCVMFACVRLEILLPCGNKLVPTFHEGQQLDGNMIQKVLKPSEPHQSVYGETSDSEDNCGEEEVDIGDTEDECPSQSSRSCKKSTGNHTVVSASAQNSTAELPAAESHAMPRSTSTQHETIGQASASFHPSTNAQACSSNQQETPKSTRASSPPNGPTSRRWQNNYGTYINLINDAEDDEEDEQQYTAIIASIEDQT